MTDARTVLLKAMGYTQEPAPRCAECTFHVEKDGFVDRSWDSYCHLNTAFPLSIKPDGRCKHFKAKGTHNV